MEENNKEKVILKTEVNTKISDLLKEQIANSKYPVVGALFNNEYKNLDVNSKKMKKFQKKLATLCKVWYTKDVGKLIKSS